MGLVGLCNILRNSYYGIFDNIFIYMQNVHPDFLKELQQLLPPQEVEQFLDACFRPLKKTITLNISKIDIATFIETTKLW